MWFKVDDKLPTSPKVMRIPRAFRLSAVGLWTTAGAWSAAHEQDGRVPAYMVDEWCPDGTLAGHLVTVGLWVETADGYAFHDWGDYQPTRAENDTRREAERKRKEDWRRRKAEKSGQSHADVPPGQTGDGRGTDGNVPSIPTRPDPTRPSNPSPDGEGARKRATRIPEPFLVTHDMRDWAAENTPDVDVDAATRKFVDYWRAESGAKAAKRDWTATWRNWLRREAERFTSHGGPVSINRAAQRQAESLSNVAQLAALDAARSKGIEA